MVTGAPREADGRTYWIEVYGCQMNVSDSELICGIMDRAGFTRVEGPGSADILLVVTCAVRERAEVRALGRVTHLGGLSSSGGRRPVTVMCGCVAQEHGNALLEKYPSIDLVVGPDRYADIPSLLSRGRMSSTAFGGHHYEGVEPVRRTFPRSFVTIMRGCDNFCSYCIVPFVRGRERSRPPEDILGEVAGLSKAGYREITLLGQNVNSYSFGGMGFPALLEAVSREAAPAWVRFVTSHPRDLTDELVGTMAACGNVCRQLHLPVQSGSDRILTLMNRGYDRDSYLGRVGRLRRAMPGIVLSTDMIAGFPGETGEEFDDSLSLLAEVGFDYAFLFRYSERTGTAAAGMDGSIPEEVRLERLARLQDLQAGITRMRSRALIGKSMPVLVTGPGTRPGAGQTLGRTAGNRAVVLAGEPAEAGSFILGSISSSDGWTHFASMVGSMDESRPFEASESWPAPDR